MGVIVVDDDSSNRAASAISLRSDSFGSNNAGSIVEGRGGSLHRNSSQSGSSDLNNSANVGTTTSVTGALTTRLPSMAARLGTVSVVNGGQSKTSVTELGSRGDVGGMEKTANMAAGGVGIIFYPPVKPSGTGDPNLLPFTTKESGS